MIYLTGECNIRCAHCFVGNDQLRPRKGMSTKEICAVLRQLQKGGVDTVTLLGGEPTLRKDFTDIVSAAEQLGLYVSVNSNLIDFRSLYAVCQNAALKNIVVSLDGIEAQSHDKMRGKGSFAKTMNNLRALTRHKRYLDGDLTVDMTFVLTAANRPETPKLAAFAAEHGFRTINFKTLQYNDRAEKNKDTLAITGRDLLDALVEFYVGCLMREGSRFNMYIPPALGEYLAQATGTPCETITDEACGGTSVYSYVDLLGNNFPCPAMSFEENENINVSRRIDRLNLAINSFEDVHKTSVFKGFDTSIKRGHRKSFLAPCNTCVFLETCSPCTNEIIRGSKSGAVAECLAVQQAGNDRAPGITSRIFRRNPDDQPSPT